MGRTHVLHCCRRGACRCFQECAIQWLSWGQIDIVPSQNLSVPQWARSERFPWDKGTYFGAARRVHLEVLKYAQSNGFRLGRKHSPQCCRMRSSRRSAVGVIHWLSVGRTHVLQGCRRRSWRCSQECAIQRLSLGHVDILLSVNLSVPQWARSEGCPWKEGTSFWAAQGEHLDVLKYRASNGSRLGRRHAPRRCRRRLSGRSLVCAIHRLPMGRTHVLQGCRRGACRCSPVCAIQRLSLAQVDIL